MKKVLTFYSIVVCIPFVRCGLISPAENVQFIQKNLPRI